MCKHQFIHISELTKARPGQVGMNGLPGAEAGCIKCGQIRKIWADGTLEIVIEGSTHFPEDDQAE